MADPSGMHEKPRHSNAHIPPQNLEAEQSLLGGLLVDPESINKM
jgi:hypothetical protein